MLLYGNCTNIIPTLPSVDLTVTSPPYYNAREYSQYSSVGAYMDEMATIFESILAITKPSRMCAINISPVLVARKKRSEQSYRIPLPFYYVPMMERIGWEFLEDIIWKKPDGAVPNRNGKFFSHRKPVAYKPNVITEYILIFKKPAPFLIDRVLKNDSLVLGDYERTNVWEFNPTTTSYHPAAFPLALPERIIRYYSYEGELVLDPFMGSGTTGLACKLLNRNFIGIEQNELFFNVAKERLNDGLQTTTQTNRDVPE